MSHGHWSRNVYRCCTKQHPKNDPPILGSDPNKNTRGTSYDWSLTDSPVSIRLSGDIADSSNVLNRYIIYQKGLVCNDTTQVYT